MVMQDSDKNSEAEIPCPNGFEALRIWNDPVVTIGTLGVQHYAFNTFEQRKTLWKDIEKVHKLVSGPWFLIGDFNNVLQAQNRVVSILVHDVGYIDLVNMMENTGLFEKDSNGDPFTWSNKNVNGTIYSRIYRVIGNMKWHQQNMVTTLKIMEPELSDHAMIFLQDQELRLTRKRQFKFQSLVITTEVRIPYFSVN
ncbi:hypothetical protein KIW84_020430 [Lathyrus oleraceus]|uniref:Uncharacterized protein n=1 Tax=Pisum sativum TaxID=3888 RepID=A0A9D4Y515_PEA|nr:hypothetical protein KIW84_020430 [Pisum sativum]